jgi:uncharacterized protein YjbI with pentapeptide repeats
MAWEITTTELLECYSIGERNFAGIDLLPPPGVSNAPRDGIDLKGAILRDINLRGADLSYNVFANRSQSVPTAISKYAKSDRY